MNQKNWVLKEIENIVLSIPGPKSISLNMNGVADPRDRGNSDEIGTIFIEMPLKRTYSELADVYDDLLEKTKIFQDS